MNHQNKIKMLKPSKRKRRKNAMGNISVGNFYFNVSVVFCPVLSWLLNY